MGTDFLCVKGLAFKPRTTCSKAGVADHYPTATIVRDCRKTWRLQKRELLALSPLLIV